ncbi:hypothetical protein RRG08_010883 [Elysia crispata]|uniref:Uncharacterized protein n=1 Tax=Elysia crispata TaxID=231223 RepID=A0AAE0Z3X2_9GAST|nr:hypothetical protein RRG08_010883 [Elysia crispata]
MKPSKSTSSAFSDADTVTARPLQSFRCSTTPTASSSSRPRQVVASLSLTNIAVQQMFSKLPFKLLVKLIRFA